MEAKDTVMSDKEMTQAAHDCWLTTLTYPKFVAVKQAEISFNAGIKEVVDWITSQENLLLVMGNCVGWNVLQSKLKEWGLE